MRLIYEKSVPGRRGVRLPDPVADVAPDWPDRLRRQTPAALPEVSEPEVVRHFTELSRRNFSVDTHFYPLGSCTMKYNPRAGEAAAALPGFLDVHPLWPRMPRGERLAQGALELLEDTERRLCEITGMAEFTLQPLAGAHGELTGAMIVAAYHRARGARKSHVLIPDSAHGTNPASARIAGFEVVTVPSGPDGLVDFDRFRAAVNDQTAAVMLTCPNTLGLFERRVHEMAEIVHAVDGLLYYDGANLNALLGRCRPADLGFDLCHLNLHKTFATPHGGGGPGAGPVGVVEKLRPFLPIPRVRRRPDGEVYLEDDAPLSIGNIAPFYGNFGVIVRAYAYLLLLGSEGLREASGMAVLNANYMQERLRARFEAVTKGRCMHEFVLSAKKTAARGVRALDFAKALIDRGFHPPTVYFPLIVPEALMIEPTETESRETLDRFIKTMLDLADLAERDPEALRSAPRTTPVGRLDEVAAARRPDLRWRPPAERGPAQPPSAHQPRSPGGSP